MGGMTFAIEEKAKMFDEIAEHFYRANFGSFSKSEFDLLMFHFYYDKLVSETSDEDGTINYSDCSDYRIGRELGITPQRVRNLKIKSQLAYPLPCDWKKALAKLVQNARYDRVSRKVVLNIPDPILQLEIQEFIESNGSFFEKQINGKILQLRVEYYIDLIAALEPEETRKKIISSLKKVFCEHGKDDAVLDEKNIGKSLINASVNILDVVTSVSGLLSSENSIGKALIELISK